MPLSPRKRTEIAHAVELHGSRIQIQGGEPQVHIVYIDDSKQDVIRGKKFQIMAAVIIADELFSSIEQELAYYVYERIPEELRDKCEIHATDILNGNAPFNGIPEPERMELLSQCASVIEGWNIPIVYGSVDLSQLARTDYATANVIDISFRRCAKTIEEWFRLNGGFGMMVADDTDKQHVKRAMLNVFRQYRQFVRSSPSERGLLVHIHDDMYFGDSKFSVGLQLADVCTLLISRHLVGYEDTEPLYKRIEPLIFKAITE